MGSNSLKFHFPGLTLLQSSLKTESCILILRESISQASVTVIHLFRESLFIITFVFDVIYLEMQKSMPLIL